MMDIVRSTVNGGGQLFCHALCAVSMRNIDIAYSSHNSLSVIAILSFPAILLMPLGTSIRRGVGSSAGWDYSSGIAYPTTSTPEIFFKIYLLLKSVHYG